MTVIHRIPLERVSTEAFAPYGELVAPPQGEPVFRGIMASSWPTNFHCGDEVSLMYIRFGWQEPQFTKLERHRDITQTFVPLAPRRFVMVVAGGTPETKDLRAFVIEPGMAVIIGENVWHALDRFLFEPEPLDCLMLTSAAVQAELELQYRDSTVQPTRTDVIDFQPRGISFRLDLG